VDIPPGIYYRSPDITSGRGIIYRMEHGVEQWRIETDLNKVSSVYGKFGLVFIGCEPNTVISCEAIVIRFKDGKILISASGTASKISSGYIILNDPPSNHSSPYDSYIISDTIINNNKLYKFKGYLTGRSSCGPFEITDVVYYRNQEHFKLNDSCGKWTYIVKSRID
jgi:hypothetical protein